MTTATSGPAPLETPADARLASVDVVRGLVMAVMVLDHVRDFLMDLRVDPTDLDRVTPALFFTRWITHFCAPTFLFLAGVGASLAGDRGRSRGELSRFLLTRGLWLVFLEQTWVCWMFFFTVPKVILAIILWAIGWSMVALAALVYLPRWAIGAVGVGLIAGHNLFDGFRVTGTTGLDLIWRVLHQPGPVPLPGGFLLLLLYPLIPWVGVMAVGYAFGPVFRLAPERRRSILVGTGLATVAAFVALRAVNVYGDPVRWAPRPDALSTAMGFLNCGKYPPSLLYLLMTLGPMLLALAVADRAGGRAWLGPIRTLGRVPLFFFLLHWPLAHGLAVILAAIRGEPVDWMFRFPPFQAPPGYGHGLATVYAAWLLIVAALYPPCRWFAGVKRRHRWAWLGYL